MGRKLNNGNRNQRADWNLSQGELGGPPREFFLTFCDKESWRFWRGRGTRCGLARFTRGAFGGVYVSLLSLDLRDVLRDLFPAGSFSICSGLTHIPAFNTAGVTKLSHGPKPVSLRHQRAYTWNRTQRVTQEETLSFYWWEIWVPESISLLPTVPKGRQNPGNSKLAVCCGNGELLSLWTICLTTDIISVTFQKLPSKRDILMLMASKIGWKCSTIRL